METRSTDPVIGQFMHPVIDEYTKPDDPWQRNYGAPPQLKNLVPREYTLTDIRPQLSAPDYSPNKFLQTHGFAVVKNQSPFIETLDNGEVTDQAIVESYHPEIQELVLKTTGAKKLFIMASVYRKGKNAPEPFKLPTGLRVAKSTTEESKSFDKDVSARSQENSRGNQNSNVRSTGMPRLAIANPVRVPHMDFTPLGARQTIRSQMAAIRDAALDGGVIAAEDKICEGLPYKAPTKEADSIIEENYNKDGNLGPRYAAYSIWRPIKTVARDPIALAPTKVLFRASPKFKGEMVYWPYENKVPGPPELGGDFVKEFAMCGVQGEQPPPNGDDVPEWFYVSAQKSDEVLFIKLFDSAALGENAEHAGAPFHGSPEIGSAAGNEARESIDIRVLVFW